MTTTSANNLHPQDHHAMDFWEPRRALTLDAARRHSSFIRMARYVLIGFAALLALTLLWYFINTPKTNEQPTNPDETVKMVSPIYKGRTGDGLPYRIVANEAVRFVQNPDEVNLTSPILNFLRNEGAKESKILALSGLYNSKDQVLELRKEVSLKTDNGNECKTSHGRIFVKNKRVEGNEAITCTGEFGIASGNAYEINDNYSEFIFKDGMTARLNPKSADEALRGPSTPEGTAPTKPKAKPLVSFGNDEPINIIAKRAVYKGPKTVLTGKVDVKQGASIILADSMDLYRLKTTDPETEKITYGNVNRIFANGHFKYTTPDNSVTGDKGVYERDKNIITVTGNVKLKQRSGNTVTGNKLIYDLTTNRAKFSNQGGRVVIKTNQ